MPRDPLSAQSGGITLSPADLERYCCVELIQAEARGYMATASGGVWIAPVEGQSCLSGLPQARFCPFCGSRIVVTRHKYGWSWRTQDKPTMHKLEHVDGAAHDQERRDG